MEPIFTSVLFLMLNVSISSGVVYNAQRSLLSVETSSDIQGMTQKASILSAKGQPSSQGGLISSLVSSVYYVFGVGTNSDVDSNKVQKTLEIPMVEFKNIRRGQTVPQEFVEVQTSVHELSDKEIGILRFKLEGAHGYDQSAIITKATLSLNRRPDSGYGNSCPSNSVTISAIPAPVPGGSIELPKRGESIVSDLSGSSGIDIKSLLAGGKNGNYNDFWLMIEAGNDCYFSFPSGVDGPSVRVTILTSEPKTTTFQRKYLMLIGISSFIFALFLLYRFRKKETDYTYFYDNCSGVEVTSKA